MNNTDLKYENIATKKKLAAWQVYGVVMTLFVIAQSINIVLGVA